MCNSLVWQGTLFVGLPSVERNAVSPRSKSANAAKPARRGLLSRIGGRGRWPMKTFRWLVFLGFLGTLAAVVALVVAYQTVKLPKANAAFKTQTTNVYYSDGKTKIGSFSVQNRQNVTSSEISDTMKAAIIAAEDRSFYSNKGISVTGVLRALRNNAESGEVTSGGSTITQQYVKILYLNQERTYSRKGKEAILSVKIARKLSKEQILTNYLNTVFYGNGNYGVQVAAQNYFHTNAKNLTIPQAAYLATVVNSPTFYSPYGENAKAKILPRYQYVLSGMLKSGAITQDEYDKYHDTLPRFEKRNTSNMYAGTNGYLLMLVRQQLENLQFSDYEIDGSGLKVVTSFDKKMQADAVASVNTVGPRGQGYSQINSALVSVQPGTGAVKALYGGPDYLKSQYDWATHGTQPGSTFKVFTMIAALENGYSLNTALNGNSPIYVNGTPVGNEGDSGGESYGYISMRKALQDSVNTAFVDLTGKLGNGNYVTGAGMILDAAHDAGIPESTIKTLAKVPVTTLGVDNVTPLDMATAYATVAASGKKADWYVVGKVTEPNGQVAYQHQVHAEQVIPKDVAADTLSAMQTVVSAGTGVSGRTVCPTAGKTGTATAETDGVEHVSSQWFMGVTPKMVTAVMNNRGSTGKQALNGYLNSFYGGYYPAREFRDYANKWLDSSDCGSFPAAANIKATKGSTAYSTPSSTYTSQQPTTSTPSTTAPTTAAPTTKPTTAAPTTAAPTTAAPTTAAPTTAAPSTAVPTKKPEEGDE